MKIAGSKYKHAFRLIRNDCGYTFDIVVGTMPGTPISRIRVPELEFQLCSNSSFLLMLALGGSQ